MENFEPAYENADHVMAYYRILQGHRVLVAANFGTDTIELELGSSGQKRYFYQIKNEQMLKIS